MSDGFVMPGARFENREPVDDSVTLEIKIRGVPYDRVPNQPDARTPDMRRSWLDASYQER